MALSTYLINLDRSKARLIEATNALGHIGIAFERIAAFVGSDSLSEETRQEILQRSNEKLGRKMSSGEIGCYLSHLNCLINFLDTDSEFCLVFEDDFEIGEVDIPLLNELLGRLQNKSIAEKFNVINLGHKNKRIYSNVENIEIDNSAVQIRNSHYFPFTTTALIWSRAGAKNFLKDCNTISCPIDIELQYFIARNGGGWTCDYALVRAGKFESDIETLGARTYGSPLSRKKNRQRHTKLFWSGIANMVRHRLFKNR